MHVLMATAELNVQKDLICSTKHLTKCLQTHWMTLHPTSRQLSLVYRKSSKEAKNWKIDWSSHLPNWIQLNMHFICWRKKLRQLPPKTNRSWRWQQHRPARASPENILSTWWSIWATAFKQSLHANHNVITPQNTKHDLHLHNLNNCKILCCSEMVGYA